MSPSWINCYWIKKKSKTHRCVIALKANLCKRQHQSTITCRSSSHDAYHCMHNSQKCDPCHWLHSNAWRCSWILLQADGGQCNVCDAQWSQSTCPIKSSKVGKERNVALDNSSIPCCSKMQHQGCKAVSCSHWRESTPCKDNIVQTSHQYGIYVFLQVNYMCECWAKFADESICLSCDDMNNIHVGTLAVFHYHQIHRFLPVEDHPIYSDNDFLFRNSKIFIPSGYMVHKNPNTRSPIEQRLCHLRSKSFTRATHRASLHWAESRQSRSFSPSRSHNTSDDFNTHKLHQLHRRVRLTGLMRVFNQSARFHQATSVCHANDMAFLVQKDLTIKCVVSALVDGGPDFNPRHLENLLSFGQLWQDLRLDFLMITCHAPGLSAYNPLEHAWDVLDNALTGVTLAHHLPDESPPEDQNLSRNELCRKQAILLDLAIDKLCGYWNNTIYDGHPVHAHKVRYPKPEGNYNDTFFRMTLSKPMKRRWENLTRWRRLAYCTTSYATMLFGQLTTVSFGDVQAQRAVIMRSIQFLLQSSCRFCIYVVAVCFPKSISPWPFLHLPWVLHAAWLPPFFPCTLQWRIQGGQVGQLLPFCSAAILFSIHSVDNLKWFQSHHYSKSSYTPNT